MSSHLTHNKCPLCSKLSSGLRRLYSRFLGTRNDCQDINRRTLDDNQRVLGIIAAAPNCVCEKFRMSTHSPCVVEDHELLARFVFSPMHVGKKGKLKPSVFSHVQTKGCSIQRESIAEDNHSLALVREVIRSKDDIGWQGVLFGQCGDIRRITVGDTKRRSICVYDTADHNNPAHGELCQTQHFEEDDIIELRHNLLVAFDNGSLTSPNQYRNGATLNSLSTPL